jgi:hypothetical protein
VIAHPNHAGLFRGAPAIAYTLRSAGLPSYTAALATLDSHIEAITRQRLVKANARIDRGELPALREYDLINGLTGIGTYLLPRCEGGVDQAAAQLLLGEVLAYLVRLTDSIAVEGDLLPGWWCGNGPNDLRPDRWRGGHCNLGLAHGIAGPLALLATATLQGITVAGQFNAMNRILALLDSRSEGSGRHTWWPEWITRDEWRAGSAGESGPLRAPHRPSWCYGTPGLARAQQLAGLALRAEGRQRLAEAALAGCVTDPQQLDHLVDASICHGWAGLLHTTWRAALDGGPDCELAAVLPDLRTRLNEFLDRHGEPADRGLLEGAAGIELVQHAQATGTVATGWDACLLVGGTPAVTRTTTRIEPTTIGRT